MRRPTRRQSGLLIMAAVLIVAALLLGACGSSSSSSSSSPSSAGTPKAGGTYNFAIGAEPISIEPLNTQESEGAEVEHQVFQGLYILQLQPDGTTKAVPDLAETTEVNADATVFTFTIRQGVMFQAPVSREVTAQDFVDSWSYNAQAKNKSATTYIIAPIKGMDPNTGYADGPTLSGVKALDKYTLRGHAAVPVRRLPGDAGAPDHARVPGRLCRTRSAARPSSTSRSAPGRTWSRTGSTTSRSRSSRTPTTGTRTAARRTRPRPGYVDDHRHADLHGRQHRVARLPEGHRRLLHHPVGQLQGRPEQPEHQGRHLDRRGLPEHGGVLHQRLDEQAHARRRRQPPDPCRPQHGRRPRGRLATSSTRASRSPPTRSCRSPSPATCRT